MLTPVEMMYINTSLDSSKKWIYLKESNGNYQVVIEAYGEYVIEFVDMTKAVEFVQKIFDASENNKVKQKDNKVIINRKSNVDTLILCRDNKELAVKLVKHLRKQRVLHIREELKREKLSQNQHEQEKRNEIDSIRF